MDDQNRQRCSQCRGSGACDPCAGYGFYPDSYPGAGDGPECEYCAGSGDCLGCHGDGTTRPANPPETTYMNGSTETTKEVMLR